MELLDATFELNDAAFRLYHTLKTTGPITRDNILKITGKCNAAVYRSLAELKRAGLVIVTYSTTLTTPAGRPAQLFSVKQIDL